MAAKFIEGYNSYTMSNGRRNHKKFQDYVKKVMEQRRGDAKKEMEKKVAEMEAKAAPSRRTWGF